MTEGEESEDGLQEDWLFKKLLNETIHIPDLIMLVGFLGNNTGSDQEDDGHRRLYLTPTLNDYVTFDKDDVILHRPPPKDSPMDGSTIWLKRTAIVQRTRIESHQMHAEFLQGSMMDDARPSMPDLPGEAGSGNTWTMVNCPPSIIRCK